MTLQLDFKQALRGLLRAKGFFAAGVACLAIGLGANMAVLSQVDHLLLRPLPFPDSKALVELDAKDTRNGTDQPWTMADFLDMRDQCRSFQEMAACTSRNRTLQGLDEPVRLNVGMVTANFFKVLGVRPRLGRLEFTRAEEETKPATSAVVRYDFWKHQLGGDPNAIGRTLVLDGHAVQVVGVLPSDFKFFERISDSAIFTPEAVTFAGRSNRAMGTYYVLGRLNPMVGLRQAATEVAAIGERMSRAVHNPSFGATATSLVSQITRSFLPVVMALQAAVGLVLLITCLSVASLQLVRNATRIRELAIRLSLGARPAVLWQMFLAEGLLLSLVGGIAGIGVCLLFQAILGHLVNDLLPLPLEVGVYPALLAAALVLSLLAGLGLALLSGMMARRIQLNETLKEGARGTFSKGHRWALKALVVGELAFSATLLLGAGLLIRSVYNLSKVKAGFESEHVLVAQIPLPPQRYGDLDAQVAFLDRLDQSLRSLPGVQEVGVNDTTPFIHANNMGFVGATPGTRNSIHVRTHNITPDYFKAMGIPVLEGEPFTQSARGTCIVSRRLAHLLWPGESALGRQVYAWGAKPLAVVAVVGNTGENSLRDQTEPQIYVSAYEYRLFEGAIASIKVQGEPTAYALAVRKAIRRLDPGLAVAMPQPFQEALKDHYTSERALGILFLGFGLMALFLAAVGLSGVISQTALQRTREIGIRMALGAQPLRIAQDVVQESLMLTSLGLAAGALMGWQLQRALAGQLFGLSSAEAPLYVAVVLVLGLVAVLSALGPALRAASIQPADALRAS